MLLACPYCLENFEFLQKDFLIKDRRSVCCGHCNQRWVATVDGFALTEVDDALAEFHQPLLMGVEHKQSLVKATENTQKQKSGDQVYSPAFVRKPFVPVGNKKRSRFSWPLLLIYLSTTIIGLLIGYRHKVVFLIPGAASVYATFGLPINLRGLIFKDVILSYLIEEGIPILLIEGKIVNIDQISREVSPLRFSVWDPTGKEIYAWVHPLDRFLLSSGKSFLFRSRSAEPRLDGERLVIQFSREQDFAQH